MLNAERRGVIRASHGEHVMDMNRAMFAAFLKACRVHREIVTADFTLVRFNAIKRKYWAVIEGDTAFIYDLTTFKRRISERADVGIRHAVRIRNALAKDMFSRAIGPDHVKHTARYVLHADDVYDPKTHLCADDGRAAA